MASVEIEKGVCDWLHKANVFGNAIPRRSRQHADTHYELDHKVAESLNDGTAICRLLHHLDPNNNKIPSPSLLKASSAPADRLHNWNILAKTLPIFKIRLDNDMKGLIVNGDLDIVLELLSELRQKTSGGQASSRSARPSHDSNNANNAQVSLDLKFLDNCREVEQASNALEFLVIVMIVKLGLHAKQAAALLTANTKYLTHMLENGVSGKFDFAAPFYSYILQHGALLAKHLHNNTATIPFILNLLCSAFNSTHEESCQWICRIFVRLAAELSNLGHGSIVQTWLGSPPEHLKAILGCYLRNVETHDAVVLVLLEMGQSQLPDLLGKQSLSGPEFSTLIVEILTMLQQQKKKQVDPVAVAPGLVAAAVKKAVECHDAADRLLCLNTLIGLFQHKTGRTCVIDSSAAVKSLLDLLKKAGRDGDGTPALDAMLNLFDAVAAGAEGGVAAATSVAVWKALVFGLFERRPGDDSLRALTSGMADRLNYHKDLAPTLIVDPLSKQIAVHGTTHLDFNFLAAVGRHHKLSPGLARTFLDVLTKILADGDDNTAGDVKPLLLELVERFKTDSSTTHSCGRVSEEALNSLLPQARPSPARGMLVVDTLEKLSEVSKKHAEVVKNALQSAAPGVMTENSGLTALLSRLGGSVSNVAGVGSVVGNVGVAVASESHSQKAPTPPQSKASNNPRKNNAPPPNVSKEPEQHVLGPRARAAKEKEEQKQREAAEEEKKREKDPFFNNLEEQQRKKIAGKQLLEQRKKRDQEIKDIIADKKKAVEDRQEMEINKRAKSAEAKNRLDKGRRRDRARFLQRKAEKEKEDSEQAEKAAKDPKRSVVASAPSQVGGSPGGRRLPGRDKPFWKDPREAHMNYVIQKYPHNRRQDVKEVADMVYDIIQLAMHGPKPPHIEPPEDLNERRRRIAKFNNPDPSRALLTKLEAASAEDISSEHSDLLQDERKRLARAEKLHEKLAEYSKEKVIEENRLKEAERVYEEIKQAREQEKRDKQNARRIKEKARVEEWRKQRDAENLSKKSGDAKKQALAAKEKQRLNAEYVSKNAERINKKKVQVEKIVHVDDSEDVKKKAAADKKKQVLAKKRAEEKKAKASSEELPKAEEDSSANASGAASVEPPMEEPAEEKVETVIAPDGSQEDWTIQADSETPVPDSETPVPDDSDEKPKAD